MKEFDEDDQEDISERVTDRVEELESNSAVQPGNRAGESVNHNSKNPEVEDISSDWNGKTAFGIGGEVTEKTDQPETERTIRMRKGKFSLSENPSELIDAVDENLQQIDGSYENVNEVLTSIETQWDRDKLVSYAEGENNPEELRFEGFTSGLGKVVEGYVTELANQMSTPGGTYRFEEGGALNSSLGGYTTGAAPDQEETRFQNFSDLHDESLVKVGEVISTLTESIEKEGQKQGKHVEAFLQYGQTDKKQSQIAEDVGIDAGDLSRRKSDWEDYGLVEDGNYTESGEVMRDMIDEIYNLRE